MPAFDISSLTAQREKLPGPLRGLIDFLAPLNDPTGGLTPTPAISLLPRARILPTVKGSPQLQQMVEKLWGKYPRLLSHVSSVEEVPLPTAGGKTSVAAFGARPTRGSVGKIIVDPEQVTSPLDLEASLRHELTHAAQELRSRSRGTTLLPAARYMTQQQLPPEQRIARYFLDPREVQARVSEGIPYTGRLPMYERINQALDPLVQLGREGTPLKTLDPQEQQRILRAMEAVKGLKALVPVSRPRP